MELSRIAVILCSVGRPDGLREAVTALARQTRRPDRLLLVVSGPQDVDLAPGEAPGGGVVPEIVQSPKGLPRQRNRGLDLVLGDCGIVVFLDDDYVPARDALERIALAFAAWPDVGGLTGVMLADGIRGPGLDAAQAAALIARHEAAGPPGPPRILADLHGLYGCNMAYRASAIGARRFDEALPLYGWQEDVDFAARIAGRRVRTDAFAGVHRGVKAGRETAGRRLGYSQVANPLYLLRKGTLPPGFALRLMAQNLLSNHLRMLRPEPWIDRRARAAGNRLALREALAGRARPDRILSL